MLTKIIYPCFTKDTIKARCSYDIDQFIKENKTKDNTNIVLETENDKLDTKEKMQNIILHILDTMNIKFGLNNAIYIHKINDSSLSKNNINQLWICRTYLLYQLFIFLQYLLSDENNYKLVYLDDDKKETEKKRKH